MKKRVELSWYTIIIASVMIALMVWVFFYSLDLHGPRWSIVMWGALAVSLCFAALVYMPLSLEVNDRELLIRRPLKIKSIPLSQIADIRPCAPTMAARKIFASNGWFGYYGWFSEADLGRYFAYYGKSSDGMLVTLKSGRKYLLGCKDAPQMLEAIKERL